MMSKLEELLYVQSINTSTLIVIVYLSNMAESKCRSCSCVNSYFKSYEENAAFTCVAKTHLNAQVSEIVNLTSKLVVIFFLKP